MRIAVIAKPTLITLLIVLVSFFFIASVVFGQNISSEEEARLRAELRQLEEEIARQQQVLNIQKGKSASIQRDVSVLRAEIEKARSVIRQQEIQIQQLGREIQNKDKTISVLNSDIAERKESLARLIQLTREMDEAGVADILLSSQSLSEFYVDANSFNALKKSIKDSVDSIRGVKNLTEEQKQQLQIKRIQEQDAKNKVEQQKQVVEQSEKEKQRLLNISKSKEQEYQQIIAERQAKAAEIRAALFRFRDAGPIPFGEAYEYAKAASAKTGIRPALILAILKQESNLGANVGTCNRPGDVRTWKDIMPGPTDNSWRDDQSAYLRVTKRLGISPDGQPLSCPLSSGGWGGAMGPSQFIPTTWEIYAPKIETTLGISLADPWNPQHAITATALYLRDIKASRGNISSTEEEERHWACIYYSGRHCYVPGVSNLFYGNAVMSIARKIQSNIDVLESI